MDTAQAPAPCPALAGFVDHPTQSACKRHMLGAPRMYRRFESPLVPRAKDWGYFQRDQTAPTPIASYRDGYYPGEPYSAAVLSGVPRDL